MFFQTSLENSRGDQLPAGIASDAFFGQLGLLSLRELSPQWLPAHACGDSFRRAGCGKSARPVRGGDAPSCSASRVALLYSIGEIEVRALELKPHLFDDYWRQLEEEERNKAA